MTEEPEVIQPFEVGRSVNGRFTYGNQGGPGNVSARINVPRVVRKYCRDLGLDLDVLIADVALTMLYNGACGDVAAARLAFDMLAVKEPSGPLVAIGIGLGERLPQPPELYAGADGAPALKEHIDRLLSIIEERKLDCLRGEHPTRMIQAIAERAAERDLLS